MMMCLAYVLPVAGWGLTAAGGLLRGSSVGYIKGRSNAIREALHSVCLDVGDELVALARHDTFRLDGSENSTPWGCRLRPICLAAMQSRAASKKIPA